MRYFETRELVLREKDSKLYKVGDYVYLCDNTQDLIFANLWNEQKLARPKSCYDSPYYPLGGGRQPCETSVEAAVREVYEESAGGITLKPDELFFWKKFCIEAREPYSFPDSPLMHGKEMNIYLAIVKKEHIAPFSCIEEDGEVWKFHWYDAEEVFSKGHILNLSEWKVVKKSMTRSKDNS